MCTFDLDLATGGLAVDDRLLELVGMDRDTFAGRQEDLYAHVHPDDAGGVIAGVQHAIASRGDYDAEYRIVLPDGAARWVAARGQVVGGEDGTSERLIGVVHDTTASGGSSSWPRRRWSRWRSATW